MALTRTPRERWIEEGLKALSAGGPDAVRVEPLAEALGVSKGGFYWQFANRDALLAEMLDTWERTSVDAVIERVEGRGGDARERLGSLFAIASSGDTIIRSDLAIRDWARRDPAVAKRLKRIDNRRMDYMRTLFGEICPDPDDAEARCLLAFSLFVGQHFTAADHEGRTRQEVLALAMRRLVARASPTCSARSRRG